MISFSGQSANEVWVQAIQHLQGRNDPLTESRLGPTKEVLHANLLIKNPRDRWAYSRFPVINPSFALAEVVWIMNGSNDAKLINHWNPSLPKFTGDADIYHGAYGHRIRTHFGLDQLYKAYTVLKNNPSTRQVVLQIWDSSNDLPEENGSPKKADIPCNICAILKIRNNKLEWSQIMRSNDLFRGLPYNFVQFTMLQEIIAGWLNLDLGSYYHLSDSLHLYTNDQCSYITDSNIPHNKDILQLPYEQSQDVFQLIFNKMLLMTEAELSLNQFLQLFNSSNLTSPYQNILLLLGADIARRKGWFTAMQQLMLNCTNPSYTWLWNRWFKRNDPKTV